MSFSALRPETKGEIFLVLYMAIFGLFPIVTNHTAKIMPPILFAAGSAFVAGVTLFFYLLCSRQASRIFHKQAFVNILGITVCNIMIPFALIFLGTSMTSSVNTVLLLQMELVFTFLFCGLFFGEKITRQKIISGAIVFIGAIMVLHNGTFQPNIGDLLIISATAIYPLGNHFSKKALLYASPAIIVCYRNLMGGVGLFLVSFLFETYTVQPFVSISNNLPVILLNGIILLGITKLFWFHGLKYLDVSKAIAITRGEPVFSLLYAFLLFGEIPTRYQFLGLLIILTGLFILTRKTPKQVVEVS